jgi:hypothetical protein
MSTNSRIGILHKNGTTETIYCHFDGYPEHHEPILRTYYNSIDKVKALIALGDISSLAPRLAPNEGEVHNFDNRIDDVVVAYHRDRGEEYNPPYVSDDDEIFADYEYVYLFDENMNTWLVFEGVRGI